MNSETLSSSTSNRIIGYDLARTLALIGMVIISFWELGGEGENSPEWLNTFVEIIMGRAAVAFVILAGIGLSLISKSAYMNHDIGTLMTARYNLRRRALFLFAVGMLNTLMWPWDILHYYAVYFLIFSFLITTSNRELLKLTSIAIVVFSIFMFIIHFERGTEWDSISPEYFWHLPGILYHLFFNGLYPVFPWIGFIFLGVWLGRRDLTNRHFRNKVLLASLTTVVFAEALSWIFFHKCLSILNPTAINKLAPWFIIDAWEPLPLFFLSGAGTAIIVICLSVIFAEKFKNAQWLSPFVAVGQSSMTLYVAHIPIGTNTVGLLDFFQWDYPLFAIWGTLSYFIFASIFCYEWNMRFKKGPLESLMRHSLVLRRILATA